MANDVMLWETSWVCPTCNETWKDASRDVPEIFDCVQCRGQFKWSELYPAHIKYSEQKRAQDMDVIQPGALNFVNGFGTMEYDCLVMRVVKVMPDSVLCAKCKEKFQVGETIVFVQLTDAPENPKTYHLYELPKEYQDATQD